MAAGAAAAAGGLGPGPASGLLKRWLCLCLFKLCENSAWARYVCLTEAGHTPLYPLLDDPDPTVRASAVLALGEMFGASDTVSDSAPGPQGPGGLPPGGHGGAGAGSAGTESDRLKITELELALQLLENCTDGSIIVRREGLIALCKFMSLPAHTAVFRLIARELWDTNSTGANTGSNGIGIGNANATSANNNTNNTNTNTGNNTNTNTNNNANASASSASPWIVPAERSARVVGLVKAHLEEWSGLGSLYATGDGRLTHVVSRDQARRSRSVLGLGDPRGSEDSLPPDADPAGLNGGSGNNSSNNSSNSSNNNSNRLTLR